MRRLGRSSSASAWSRSPWTRSGPSRTCELAQRREGGPSGRPLVCCWNVGGSGLLRQDDVRLEIDSLGLLDVCRVGEVPFLLDDASDLACRKIRLAVQVRTVRPAPLQRV